MTKRILTSILCLILLCGALMPSVLAAEEEPFVEEIPVEEPAEESAVEEPHTIDLGGEEIWVDPEDPMYQRMMTEVMTLDGAWEDIETFSSFQPRTADGETIRPGIDVSTWQGTINWSKVAAAGVEFVIIRGGYRGVTYGKLAEDAMFESNIKGAKAAGLKVGVYIYSQAITVEEGIEEAQYLLDLVEGYDIDLPLVIDYEYYNTDGRLYNAKLSRREATDICLAFCDTVEAAGYDSMVYANASMLNDNLYRDELDRVWLAHYTKKTSYSGDYEFWQCSQWGSVSGVNGDVDLNFWFDPTPVEPEPTPTPTPTTTPIPEADDPFTDVVEGLWFYDTVMAAYEQGIVNGVSDTLFNPYGSALRGQVVTMLHRLMGEPEAETEAGFEDLTESYYKAAVNWAAESGVVQGWSETQFAPNVTISRQDLVTILYRLEGSPEVTGDLSAYGDGDSVSGYAEKAMIWAVSGGILTGDDSGKLTPKEPASRAQVCAILMRYMDMGE